MPINWGVYRPFRFGRIPGVRPIEIEPSPIITPPFPAHLIDFFSVSIVKKRQLVVGPAKEAGPRPYFRFTLRTNPLMFKNKKIRQTTIVKSCGNVSLKNILE